MILKIETFGTGQAPFGAPISQQGWTEESQGKLAFLITVSDQIWPRDCVLGKSIPGSRGQTRTSRLNLTRTSLIPPSASALQRARVQGAGCHSAESLMHFDFTLEETASHLVFKSTHVSCCFWQFLAEFVNHDVYLNIFKKMWPNCFQFHVVQTENHLMQNPKGFVSYTNCPSINCRHFTLNLLMYDEQRGL